MEERRKPWRRKGRQTRADRAGVAAVTQLRSSGGYVGLSGLSAGDGQLRLYRQLRRNIPILDAAVCKLVRLVGGFTLEAEDPAAQAGLEEFLRTVPCGRGQVGAESFLGAYLDCLFTCGRAVGEMIVAGGRLAALNWGDPAQLLVRSLIHI